MFNKRSGALALGTMCCVSIGLFLIASTIVLSLIPLYLSDHGSSLNNLPSQSEVFYLLYATTAGDNTVDYSVFIGDLSGATQQFNQQLGLRSNTISIQNMQLGQQRNSGNGRRKKRASNDALLLICQGNYRRMCRSSKCRQQFLDDIQQRSANNPSIHFQLRSVLANDQTIQLNMEFLSFTSTVPTDFTKKSQTSTSSTTSQASTSTTTNQASTSTTASTCCNQQPQTNIPLVQQCIGQDLSRQPIIIDTDVDVDDLWAILYLVNVPTVNILAITTVGDGFSTAFYSTSNVLSFLGVIGCTDGIAVATGISTSSSDTGYVVSPPSYLVEVDTYITSPTCLNQSTNIFLQPSPFEAVELMIYALKYSQRPVDILALGPFTNIAAAITRDRSIVSKIGTVYASGGQVVSLSANPTLTPNPNLGMYPYIKKTSGTSSNVFIDVLAVQRVDQSGIKNFVVIPSLVQRQVNANITQLNQKIQELNLNLTPFIYGVISSFARCTNQSELFVNWWDNSAAQLMVQIQNNVTNGFCTTLQNEQSLYLLSADADQLYGEGLTDITNTRPNTNGVRNDTVCTQANSDIFLTEFLTKIASNKFYSCEKTFSNRFDIKLQSCLSQYGYN